MKLTVPVPVTLVRQLIRRVDDPELVQQLRDALKYEGIDDGHLVQDNKGDAESDAGKDNRVVQRTPWEDGLASEV